MTLRPSEPECLLPPMGGVDLRRQAKFFYWMGWTIAQIAEWQGSNKATLRAWKSRDKWDKASPMERSEGATEARYMTLVAKPVKTGADFKEIDLLGRQMERFARIRRYEAPDGHEGDLNPNIAARNAGPRKKPVKNNFTAEQVMKLRQIFEERTFAYQKFWAAAGMERSRLILKSRQIGATWYFALEALLDALETGRNQIFLSASKSQARVFRGYILDFAAQVGVELFGDPLVVSAEGLTEAATLYFLGTNMRTAQSYHGNLYFDEFFWVYGFKTLEKVASGMAMHKKWRKTYFSTPSTITHEAFAFWNGEDFNRRRPKAEQRPFDVSHENLRGGKRLADKKWRQIVNIEDAMAGGCDLFDIDELRYEYSQDAFDNLLMCHFIDDTQSVFPLSMMRGCHVDSWDAWDDFSSALERPFGNRPVWIGYDPSHTGDAAALVIIAPPAVAGQGKFRILHKEQFRGMDFAAQAAAIERFTRKYNVAYIGIDATGLGEGVLQLVKNFFPRVRSFKYSPELKNVMVLKAQDVIRNSRLEYDAGWTDVTQSFMAIKRAVTLSGRGVTYEAGRSELTGHADLAWATMHALMNEPLDAPMVGAKRSVLEIY